MWTSLADYFSQSPVNRQMRTPEQIQEQQLINQTVAQMAPSTEVPQFASMEQAALQGGAVDALPDMSDLTAYQAPPTGIAPTPQPMPQPQAQPQMGPRMGASLKANQNAQRGMKDRLKEYMDQREELLKNSLERARIMNGGYTPEPDLRGLMALADAWGGGGHFQRAYQPPKTREEHMLMQQRLEDNIGQKMQGLSNTALGYMRMEAAQDNAARNADLKQRLAAFKAGDKASTEAQKTRQHFGQSKVKTRLDDTLTAAQATEDYYKVLNKYKGKSTLVGKERAEVESAYKRFIVTYNSKVAELGALAGQDLNILQGIANEQFGLGGAVSDLLKGGKNAQLPLLKKMLGRARTRMGERLGDIEDIYQTGVEDSITRYKGRLKNYDKYLASTKPQGGLTAEQLKTMSLEQKKAAAAKMFQSGVTQ